jgi:uncharacterized protein YjbI with pentapeptide repeats
MAPKSSLSERWRTDTGVELAAQIVSRFAAREPLGDLALQRHEGRIDLRGFLWSEPTSAGETAVAVDESSNAVPPLGMRMLTNLVELHGARLADLAMSGGQLQHLRLFDSTLRNCIFDDSDCEDWRAWNLSVEDCSFRGADLTGSVLGSWYKQKGNRFSSVDFTAADLRGIVCRGATFLDCDFGEARLDKVEFQACDFVRCRFAGLLDEVRFLGDPSIDFDKPEFGRFENVDFSGATLRRVEFRDLSLDRMTLPEESDDQVVVRNYPCVVRRAVARLENDPNEEFRKLRSRMRAASKRLDETRTVGVWHTDELGATPEQQRAARQLLHDLERACDDEQTARSTG